MMQEKAKILAQKPTSWTLLHSLCIARHALLVFFDHFIDVISRYMGN